MRVGSFSGKGVVYNKKGKPILDDGEKIVKKLNEKCGISYRKRKRLLWFSIFEYGSGDIYLTNKRFIYLRQPLSCKEIVKQSGIYGYADAITYDLTARDMKRYGVLEFIEFEYKEIGKFSPGFFGSALDFFAEKGTFRVVTKKYILNEIKKVMRKVKSK